MIESITIKNVASYDSIGVQVNGLKKVNFIYGANGCGKTTISNFLQNTFEPKFNRCSLVWQNTIPLNTLVYNKEFRERNFGKGKLGGVFTLGEATAEQIKIINDKTEELKVLKADGVKKRETLESQIKKKEDLENEFRDNTWTKIYKKYEHTFKEAFTGTLQKESFKNKLLQEFSSNTSALETFEDLKEKAKTIFGEVPQPITPIDSISFDRIVEIENDEIWKKIIVGKADVDIAKLIQKLNINDWVNQGRDYLLEDETCPFCQEKTITENFKNQLESFFDETYLNDIKSIKDLKQEYNSLTQNLINELNAIETYQKDFKQTKLNNDKYSAYLKTLISQNTTNNELLNNKVKEPSRNIEINSLKDQLTLISELITNTNIEIAKHNNIVANYNTEKNNLIRAIWKLIIEEFKTDVTKFNTDKNGLELGINSLQTQISAKLSEYGILDAEIKNLTKNVTSIEPTINEINRLLKSYGFLNFEIVPASEDGFYQIQREDGTIAEATLSEGEITFITFLYFLQLAKGGVSEETVNEERILIIDDPISSLDSSVLFVVSTLIKELIKDVKAETGNIKQIILLTHNVYFHKEVSYEGLNRKGEKSQFWILRKNNKISTIQFYAETNPIQSSYELLWREIREWEKNSGITIQNTLRRILENYFSILGNKRDDVLINKFSTQEEREICRSLLSWANEGSHTLPDDLFIEAPDGTITKYLDVFKNIFIYTENTGHYNMMMNIDENNN
ncbi:AAA family ATPase [Flavobacterium sedimenticola]|uniref:AAA family ATPase n=1 Tax=Flavobacterium sedimenticola TaxID=3043286 RepID=A0ABT6XQ22_9FLAO|nr:AAA family ATPase [Flavobacterium sedimenticola]MDI9257085.1 AAA family ATPase [Flavobacterium sedimenticola]